MKDLTPIWHMLLATFLFGLMKVFVKSLPDIPVIEIILFRSIISLFLSLWGIYRAGVPVFGSRRALLVCRGLAGAVALGLNYYLLQEIPLATASTMTYLAPIFTTVIGIWFVKERVSLIQFLFFAVSFLGILIIQGYDDRISLIHLLAGISSSVFMGLAYNLVRKLNTSEHPLVIIFYFPLVLLPISGVWSAFVWVQPSGWEWFNLLMVGVTTQLAQYYMTRSYQGAELSVVSIINYTGIFYSLVFGFLLFDETYSLITYLGIALVLGGVVMNVIFKRK